MQRVRAQKLLEEVVVAGGEAEAAVSEGTVEHEAIVQAARGEVAFDPRQEDLVVGPVQSEKVAVVVIRGDQECPVPVAPVRSLAEVVEHEAAKVAPQDGPQLLVDPIAVPLCDGSVHVAPAGGRIVPEVPGEAELREDGDVRATL